MNEPIIVPYTADKEHNSPEYIRPSVFKPAWTRSEESLERKKITDAIREKTRVRNKSSIKLI
jgi:hypothetical protein